MARILLADDDATSRDLVQRALAADGHSVVGTHDGAEALERLSSSFDVLVTDVQMPAMDGITLAEKALAAQPGLAVVLISGYAEQLDRARGLRARRIGSLLKPFTLEQIRHAVRSVLG